MNGLERVYRSSQLRPAPYLLLAIFTGLFLALAPIAVAAGVVAGCVVLILALIRIEFGLAFLAFSIPFGALESLGIDTLGLSATEPLVVVVAFAWVLKTVANRDDKISFSPVFPALVAFIGVLLLGMSTALSLSLSTKELLKWIGLLVVFVVAANSLKTRQQFAIVLASIIAAATLEALVGWYQFFGRVGPEGFLIGGQFMRAYGTFGQPNPFAGYLALAIPLAYLPLMEFEWLKTRPVLSLILVAGSVAIIGGAIVMSLSRGAWLGFAVAFFVVTSLKSRKAFFLLLGLVSIIVVLVSFGALNLLPGEFSQRFTDVVAYFGIFDVREVEVTQENWAVVERMASWQAAWNMFQDNVWLGLGPGNFAAYYPDYSLPGWEDTGGGHAHNIYLNFLAETGIVGLAVYLALVAVCFIYLLVSYSRSRIAGLSDDYVCHFGALSLPVPPGMLALGAIGMLVALQVHSFFDNLYVHGMPVQIGLVLGMAVAAINGARGNPNTHEI